MQSILSKDSKTATKKLRFDAERGRTSRNGKKLELQENGIVYSGGREKLEANSGTGGPRTAASSAALNAREQLKGCCGSMWHGVKLGRRRELVVKGKTSFARGIFKRLGTGKERGM